MVLLSEFNYFENKAKQNNCVLNLVEIIIYFSIIEGNAFIFLTILWVLASSTGKVFDGGIRDLRFNPCLYQKLIGVLV